MLTGADGRFGAADPLRRRFDVLGLRALAESVGLLVDSVTGVGVLTGLVSAAARLAGARRGNRTRRPGGGRRRTPGPVAGRGGSASGGPPT